MSNKITIKRSAVTGKVPEPSDLDYGEFALNYTDGNLFFKSNANVITNLASTQFVSVTGNVTGNYFIGNGSQLTGVTAAAAPAGNTNEVQINGGGVTSASANFTFDGTNVSVLGNITGNYFIGNGSGLSAITGANVTGQVGNALVSGTVYTAAQPNITSVGTLTSVSVTGTATAGNLSTAGTVSATGNILGGNLSGTSIVGTLTTAAQTNITSVGTLSALSVTGNITGGNLVTAGAVTGNGRALTSLNATNIDTGTLAQARLANAAVTLGSTALTLGTTTTAVTGLSSVTSTTFVGALTGAATTAGTVTTAAQPNITSVGTLTSVSITGNTTSGNFTTAGLVNTGTLQTSGNAIVGGNLIVNGNTISVNVTNLNVQDPIIGLGRGANNAPLTSNDGKDRGTEMWYYNTAERAAFVGYDNSTGKLIAAANVSITDEIVTVNNYGTFVAGAVESTTVSAAGNVTGTTGAFTTVTGNANATSLTSGTVPSARLSGTYTITVSGAATTAGTVTTAAQPNITSVGTLSSVSVTGNVTAGNLLGTIRTAAQPNITSVGTLSSLSVTGNVTANNITAVNSKANTVTIVTNTTDAVFTKDDNLTAWEYSGKSFSVAAQETVPTGLFFSPDGTRMYVIGSTGDDVNQYSLGTPWDINTASFVQVSATIGETAPSGVFFKPDGTVMYITGTTNDTIREFSLSVAWDVSTITFVRDFSLAAQDTAPQDIWFRPDGTKMYMVGSTNDRVYEYDLSTAWNVSTATFVQFFSVVAQDTVPVAVNFSSDGTRMYVLGQTGLDINRYTLSIPWDISTAVFFNNFYVGFQETGAHGMFIDLDAEVAYVLGSTADQVFEYDTSTDGITLESSSGLFISGSLYTNKNLVVTDSSRIDGSLRVSGVTTLTSTLAVSSTTTLVAAVTMSTTTSAINLGTSQTTGAFTIGGTSQTGVINIGRSTANQSIIIANGVTASGSVKTIDIGTLGASGSNTNVTIGSVTAGAVTTTTIYGNTTVANLAATGLISATGNITGGNVTGTTGAFTTVTGNANATSLTSGTVPAARLSGTYTITVSGAATTAGTVTTAAQPNITSVGTMAAATITTLSTAGITKTGTNGVGNIGAAASTFNTVFAKATSAQYADVAEQYQADADYPPGTVLVLGGAQEVTASAHGHDTAVAGVVSQRPSYLMNAGLQTANSVPVALLGRVPCQVVGTITRGQLLVTSSTPGTATALDHTKYVPGCVIGKALEDYNSNVAGMIEIAVGIK